MEINIHQQLSIIPGIIHIKSNGGLSYDICILSYDMFLIFDNQTVWSFFIAWYKIDYMIITT